MRSQGSAHAGRGATRVGAWLVAAIGFAVALTAAAPHGHLEDSAIFAQHVLELPHTPAALFARVCTLVPIGPIALRLSLASALCLAALGFALYRTVDVLLALQGITHARLRALLSFGVCAWAYSAEAVLFQGLRPGAHALTTALALLLCSMLARWTLERSECTRRTRLLAALGLGLLCAQDPAAFAGLSVAFAIGLRYAPRVGRAEGILLALCCGFAASLRALGLDEAGPSASLASSSGAGPVLQLLSTHPLLLGAALLGAVALGQHERTRPSARLWGCAAAGALLSGVWTAGATPAAHGGASLAIALCAATVLKAGLCGALLVPDGTPRTSVARLQLIAAGALAAAGLFSLQITASRIDLAGFALGEALAAQSYDALPGRALVVYGDARDFAAARAYRAENQTRPDVFTLSLPALDAPRSASAFAHGNLRGLARTHLLEDGLFCAELQSLSGLYPVLLDASAAAEPSLARALYPSHLLYELPGVAVSRWQEEDAQARHARELTALRSHAAGAGPAGVTDRAALELLARLPLAAAAEAAARP